MAIKENVSYVLYDKSESPKLEKLMEVYKKNPYAARVMFFNGGKNEYFSKRLVGFFQENGDFEICHYQKTFGVSVTNRMYSREKKEASILYTKKKFYFKHNKKITQLTFNGLYNFLQGWSYTSNIGISPVFEFLVKRFSWIRFIIENPVLHDTSFNTFTRYKLYNLNDALRHVFKCPLPVIKVLLSTNEHGNLIHRQHALHLKKMWMGIEKHLKNVENLKVELFRHHLFEDACRMAKILGKKVNCSWSLKRLTEEHDKWSREITFIVLSNEPKYDLKISEIYREFAEYSGYRLLTTNIDMLGEGMIQKHCVGTYIDKVNRGQCAIFHIEGYTLDVRYSTIWDNKKLAMTKESVFHVNQFRGKNNNDAPKELEATVKQKVAEFNEVLKQRKYVSVKEPVDNGIEFVW